MYGYWNPRYLTDANTHAQQPYYPSAVPNEGSVYSSADACLACDIGGEGSYCERHVSSQLTVSTELDSQLSNELENEGTARTDHHPSNSGLADGSNIPAGGFQWGVQHYLHQESGVGSINSQELSQIGYMGAAVGDVATDSLQRMHDDLANIEGASSHNALRSGRRARAIPKSQSNLLAVEQASPGVRRRRSSSSRGTRPVYECPEEGCDYTSAKRTDVGRHLDGAAHRAIKYYCPVIFPDGAPCGREFVGRPDNLKRHLCGQHYWSTEQAKAYVTPFDQQAQARRAASLSPASSFIQGSQSAPSE